MTPPVLWQFRFSHYNEKARWALDWKGIAHVRRSLLPGFHIPRVLWMTGQRSLPVLVLDRETIHDSTRIIERLERLRPEPALYPADAGARRRAPRAGRLAARVPLPAAGPAARGGRALARLPGEPARVPLGGRDVPAPPRRVGRGEPARMNAPALASSSRRAEEARTPLAPGEQVVEHVQHVS